MHNCYLCHRPLQAATIVDVRLKWSEMEPDDTRTSYVRWVHRECLDRAERLINCKEAIGAGQ